MRLGILTSHPIQYQAPWFRGLAREVELEVFFCHHPNAAEQGGAGFGVAFEWDVDLLSGYRHRFLKNVAAQPGVNRFCGCDTPEIKTLLAGTRAREDGGWRMEDGNSTPSSILHPPSSKPFDAFIVSGWHLKSYWQAVRACRRAGIPVLVRGDSQLRTPRSWWKRWAKEIVYRGLVRQFDGFLIVGQRNREYLTHYGVHENKLFFAPHFVDNEWFNQKAETLKNQKPEIRKTWGADDETFVALFVGKFQAIKRPGDLLHALALLKVSADLPVGQDARQRVPTTLAVFVGAGELENELRATATRLAVRAHFAGFKNQSELPACYAAADVVVLPSKSETWGLVVNEAMACGTPVIVSDAVGCAPDLIKEGKTGFVFPVGNVAELAARLELVAQSRHLREAQKKSLAEKMTTYSVQTAVAGTVAAVRTLAEGLRK